MDLPVCPPCEPSEPGLCLTHPLNSRRPRERKGWRKFENFKILRASDDAAAAVERYVFVGDNGRSEKDLEAAERIVAAFPDALAAVFLHAVSGDVQPAPLPGDTAIDGVPVRYFRTYASAAAKATELGLLDGAAARRVLDSVETDMAMDRANVAPGSANERLLRDELEAARAAVGGPGRALVRMIVRPVAWPLRRLRAIGQ